MPRGPDTASRRTRAQRTFLLLHPRQLVDVVKADAVPDIERRVAPIQTGLVDPANNRPGRGPIGGCCAAMPSEPVSIEWLYA